MDAEFGDVYSRSPNILGIVWASMNKANRVFLVNKSFETYLCIETKPFGPAEAWITASPLRGGQPHYMRSKFSYQTWLNGEDKP